MNCRGVWQHARKIAFLVQGKRVSDIQVSERLMDLIFAAVDEALNALRGEQGLNPFLLLLTKGGYVLQRFNGDTLSAQIDKAYYTLKKQNADTLAYALVYDAVVTVDERDTDAVMVEAGEREYTIGVRFVQRYQPKSDAAPMFTIGSIALLGEADHHLPD
jgi:hypothetical protein